MRDTAVILDGFTVEPSGLGVPPFISSYVRQAYSALRRAYPDSRIVYLTIDDLRWCLNGGRPFEVPPLSDALTYSATSHRDDTTQLLAAAAAVVVIAGDKVPSVHLHARNASTEELVRALAYVRGRRILLGPLSTYAWLEPAAYQGLFDAIHTHTITSTNILSGSRHPASYSELQADRVSYHDLLNQMQWRVIAEIELYRGCTRRRFCSFCNEPVKSPDVVFRDPVDYSTKLPCCTTQGSATSGWVNRHVSSPTTTGTSPRSSAYLRPFAKLAPT
jgi:radical SAM superfamily enzyme with C-terminal helix-hairpin-helix motif